MEYWCEYHHSEQSDLGYAVLTMEYHYDYHHSELSREAKGLFGGWNPAFV